MGVTSRAREVRRVSKGSSRMSCPPEGGWRWLGGWGRAVVFPCLSDHIRLTLKFYTGCTLSWSCRQHNRPQGHRWWMTEGEGQQGSAACAAPHAAAELRCPDLSCIWENFVVARDYIASPRGCSSGAEPLSPWSECQNASPSLWGYIQADAVAVCPLGASQCWRNLQRCVWTVLRADLHVSHSYHWFIANDLILSIFENISCYQK